MIYLIDTCVFLKNKHIPYIPAEVYSELFYKVPADINYIKPCYHEYVFVTTDRQLKRLLSAWSFKVMHPKNLTHILRNSNIV